MILDKIVDKKREDLIFTKEKLPLEQLISNLENRTPLDFYGALKNTKEIAIIAEVKKASPSKGLIRERFDHLQIARDYVNAGVQAMSVLTEEHFFQGSPSYLSDIRGISDIPLLRKDFIIDEYQIYEAFSLGADAVLLIAAILSREELKRFGELAHSLGLQCLAEVHNRQELETVLSLPFRIVGINNRNLITFEENLTATEQLAADIPADRAIVSESGIRTREDIRYVEQCGADAVLIGETFMRAADIRQAVLEMR